MINELKGNKLARVMQSIRIYRKDKVNNIDRVILKKLHSGQSNTSIRNYLLIDFYEWLRVVTDDPLLLAEIPDANVVTTKYQIYKRFISLTDKKLNVITIGEISNQISYDNLEGLMELYEIFMREMEKMQLDFLEVYQVNNSTNPVAIIPWSYGLNRLCKEIIIIEERKDNVDPKSETVPELGKTEGLNNQYKGRLAKIDDGMSRLIEFSPIKLFYLKMDMETEDLLPNNWRKFFDDKVKREQKGYPSRLELIKGLFGQYTFYGRNELEDFIESKVCLINYPFLLDPENTLTQSQNKNKNMLMYSKSDIDITVEPKHFN